MTETKPVGINAALADLQTQLPYISKDNTAKVSPKTGGSYQYKYADLGQISREVLPLLGKLGLSFTSRPTLTPEGRLVLVYELRHVSGEFIDGLYPLPAGSPQEVGSAITYARRYCLCAVTGVAPDDDDDDAAAAQRTSVQPRQRPERPAQQPARREEPRITAEMRRDMQILFPEAGVADSREARMAYTVSVVKRQVGSSTELTQTEGNKLLEALARDAGARKREAESAQASAEVPAGGDGQ